MLPRLSASSSQSQPSMPSADKCHCAARQDRSNLLRAGAQEFALYAQEFAASLTLLAMTAERAMDIARSLADA